MQRTRGGNGRRPYRCVVRIDARRVAARRYVAWRTPDVIGCWRTDVSTGRVREYGICLRAVYRRRVRRLSVRWENQSLRGDRISPAPVAIRIRADAGNLLVAIAEVDEHATVW